MGSVKAAVLPVPVWAAASTSRPGEDEGDGGCLDRRRGGVALFGNGREQIGRQAERIEGQAWLLRGSRPSPAGFRGSATAAPAGARWRGRTSAARSIAEIRTIASRASDQRCIGLRRRRGPHVSGVRDPGSPRGWHTAGPAPRPQTPDRQAQPKTAAPTAGPCRSSSGDRHSTATARLTRATWNALAPRSPRSIVVRPHPSPAPFLPPAAPPPSSRPHAMFRKKEARVLPVRPRTAPSGRPITGHFALTAFALIAALVAGLGVMANPQETRAASLKVVVVVGPVGSSTAQVPVTAPGTTHRSPARTVPP